jgi:hypothetical protein
MLESWLDFRRQPPTPMHLLRRHERLVTLNGTLLLAAIGVYAFMGDAYWTGGAIGFALAVFLQRVQKLRVATLGWPVTAEFLDWARIDDAARGAGLDARSARDGVVE